MHVGLRIREARRERRLTLKDLGLRTGASISFLSDVENGKRKPSYETARQLHEQLGVDLDEICAGFGIVPPDVARALTQDPARLREVRDKYRESR